MQATTVQQLHCQGVTTVVIANIPTADEVLCVRVKGQCSHERGGGGQSYAIGSVVGVFTSGCYEGVIVGTSGNHLVTRSGSPATVRANGTCDIASQHESPVCHQMSHTKHVVRLSSSIIHV